MDPIIAILSKNRKKLLESMTPDNQYRDYLDKHRQGVRSVYDNILYPILEKEDIDEDTLSEIDALIDAHDASKDGPDEFPAYRDHFYNPKANPRSGNEEYDQAWNHHQKSNPHHWQYWCLVNDVDTPQVQPLDMPFKYIIEMLCDWQSAGSHYGNSAYDWYDKQKDKMILSENTRSLVEKYIVYLKKKGV